MREEFSLIFMWKYRNIAELTGIKMKQQRCNETTESVTSQKATWDLFPVYVGKKHSLAFTPQFNLNQSSIHRVTCAISHTDTSVSVYICSVYIKNTKPLRHVKLYNAVFTTNNHE